MTTTVSVAGVTFSNSLAHEPDGTRWVLTRLRGWRGAGVGVRSSATDRPTHHGTFRERAWRSGRTVVIEGFVECPDATVAEDISDQLDALAADGQFVELTVTDGRTTSATVHREGQWTVDWDRADDDTVYCQLIFYAPDPLRYGRLVSTSTPFPELVGGLRYPLYTDGAGTVLGYLDYGDPSTTGVIELTNPGTADAWPQFQVAGPVQGGFEITRVGTPARRVYDGDVPPGSFLVDDTATGVVAMDGDSDRTLTVADPMPVGPGETAAFAFAPRGPRTAAVLTAGIRPAWW